MNKDNINEQFIKEIEQNKEIKLAFNNILKCK